MLAQDDQDVIYMNDREKVSRTVDLLPDDKQKS